MFDIKKAGLLSLIFLLSILHFSLNGQNKSGIELSGDIIQIAIPSSAFLTSILKKDKQGIKQFGIGFGLNFIATHGLKRLINKERPNGGAHAFPSGHTSAAFQGATYLLIREGKSYGIPGLALASFVGYSRINAKKHDAWDVLAGATLGSLMSLICTDKKDNVDLNITGSASNINVRLNLNF